MSEQKDIEIIRTQEQSLRFETFDESVAAALGESAIALASEKGLAVTVMVRLSGSPVYVRALPGTAAANFLWATRKANLTELYGQSSYLLGLSGKLNGKGIVEEAGLNPENYTAHGGCFPLRLTNSLLLGSLTVSGLPQRDDHILASMAVAEFLNVTVPQLS